MAGGITKNEIPNIDSVKGALLEVLSSGRSRSFENIAADVAKVLGLTRAQRAYRIGNSKNSLFANRLVQARAELTKEGAISYRAGKVRLKQAVPADGESGSNLASSSKHMTSAATKGRKHPEGRPTICLSFQEPFASYIASGVKDVEFRGRKINVPICDLVVCASKTPKAYSQEIPGLAYGLAIGMVDVVECVEVYGEHAWKLVNPRLIKPFEVHATASFFYVANIPEAIPNNEESYREYILPYCFRGEQKAEDAMITSLYSSKADRLQMKYGVAGEKFNLLTRGSVSS